MRKFYTFLLILIAFGSYGSHRAYIDSCKIELNKLTEKDSSYADILNQIAFNYIYVNIDSAKLFANESIEIAEKIDHQYSIAYAYRTLGNIELIQGNFEDAKQMYAAGLKNADDRNKILLSNMHGACDIQLKNYDQALVYLLKSLAILENIDDVQIEANTYFYLAMIYEYQKKNEQAIEFYEKTLVIKKDLNDKKGIGNTLSNLSNCYKNNNDYDKALEYTLRAKEIYEELQIPSKIATSLTNLAGIYSDQGHEEKAKKYLTEALPILNKEENKSLYSSVLYSLSSSYLKTKNLERAEKYGLESMELAKITKAPDLIIQSYELLADIYDAKNNYSQAFHYSNLRNTTKDSINEVNNASIIEEMQAKFESGEKEKEILMLNQQNQIQGLTLSKTKLTRNITILCAIAFIFISAVLYNRFKIKKKANQLLHEKNKIIEIQQERIYDSINYAKTIQESIFLPVEEIKKHFSDLFIYYEPKDIVSGDFYWFSNINGKSIVVAADCTGHGVPGAFMSMMGHSILNDIVNSQKELSPARILEKLHLAVKENLKQHLGTNRAQDGMDVTVCSIDYDQNEVVFAGANNNALLVKDNELITMRGCHKGIGGSFAFRKEQGIERTFVNHTFPIQEGDLIYMYSDGYLDQFGGEKRKKFSTKQFKEMLQNHKFLNLTDQKNKLTAIMNGWMADYEQLDDQMVIGIKI
jgi:serine phosphatase RsbU (regulator of sigma subunit)/Tfp pilus assembly protein PilF